MPPKKTFYTKEFNSKSFSFKMSTHNDIHQLTKTHHVTFSKNHSQHSMFSLTLAA